MVKKTNLFVGLIILAGIFFGVTYTVSAQEAKKEIDEIKVSDKEDKAIKKFEKAKKLDEKLLLIEAFVKEFPQSPARQRVANYAAQNILQIKDSQEFVKNGESYLKIFTPDAEADLILPGLIYAYTQVKRQKDAFDTAQKYLVRHPEDVSTRLTLAIEGTTQARAGNKDFVTPTREYAVKAIELIEADKRPVDIDEVRWKEYKTQWLPRLYQTQGYIDYLSGDQEKARVSLAKATTLDSGDINSWILMASMLDDEYRALALKFNTTAAGAERDAMLVKANEKLDATIESFARVIALTDGKPEAKQINDQFRETLESYYKYRHSNTDGLQALINKYKK